jgi:hypothetical protein
MAEPLTITRSLDAISTRYTVFEEDQVLTHGQLNDLAGYLDDQDRLTRVSLLGVGIVCGLRVALEGERVTVSKGVGVTTDGDLIHLPADRTFDRFKAYDKSAPVYAPFYRGEEMLPVFELVEERMRDDRAARLGDFATQSGLRLDDMAALLLMESYVEDDDLCSGDDCDNLGQGAIHSVKVLLIGKNDLAALRENLATLDQVARSLPEVFADRPLISSGTKTASELAGLYRTACSNIHDQIVRAIRAGAGHFSDLTRLDPAQWIGVLEAIRNLFARGGLGIQYYYDFLKDVAETWNALRDLLFNETTVCCPDFGAFPKHLLLGGLEDEAREHRTGFYPSPLTGRTAGERDHAAFLAGKLDAMIRTFKLPAAGGEIRVTPSRCEDRSLEERAIPYYYEVNERLPIHRSWSWILTRRGRETSNYSYNADSYNPGAVARHLTTQIGRYDFFRVEGHLGHNVSRAVSSLEAEIRGKNLPFQVRAVALAPDRTGVKVKPPIRYNDLHRFHYLLRQDLVSQLEDSKRFSGSFKQQIEEAVDSNLVSGQQATAGRSPKDVAAPKDAAVAASADSATGKLSRKYTAYVADRTWEADVKTLLTNAGEFKADLGNFVKTEFTTPFDSVIASNRPLWLSWLDTIIQVKEEKEDEKLLFMNFLKQHPGLEHFAGVVRGGTLILVYDTNETVVADFMLPYVCCDFPEEEPEEPKLDKPPVKPPFILEKGVKVIPPLDDYLKVTLADFRKEIEPQWKRDIQIEKDYVNVFKDSIKMMGDVFTAIPRTPDLSGVRDLENVTDPFLDIMLRDFRLRVEKMEFLREETLKPNADSERQRALESQFREAEAAVAAGAAETTRAVANAKMDVKPGTEGFRALAAVSEGVGRISNQEALERVKRELTGTAGGRNTSPELKGVLNNILKIRGLGG